jgi:hypothetical protein
VKLSNKNSREKKNNLAICESEVLHGPHLLDRRSQGGFILRLVVSKPKNEGKQLQETPRKE